jgi:hypothetical protein
VTNFEHRLCQRLRKEHVGAVARPAGKVFRPLVFEPLEPRLLLSADSGLGVVYPGEQSLRDAGEPPAIVAGLVDVSSPMTFATQREEQQDPIRPISVAVEQTRARHEVVFVDTNVQGYEQLLGDLLGQSSNERRIDVHILDAQRDGIEQITGVLANYTDLDAVHFVSHGTVGAVRLGTTWLDNISLQAVADSIGGWGAALSENADLLFYGCDLAASAPGVSLIEQLSRLTGADVAASIDRTGTAVLGGDWDLEHTVGSIETGLAPSSALQQNWGAVLNSAPTASNLSAAETYALATPLNLADIVISDVDSANVTATLTLSDPAAGILSTGTSGLVTSTYDTATGVWTASGAIADVNALLADLTYNPSLLPPLSFTIATSVDDGVAPAITGSKSMTLVLLNLPPSATNLNAAETYTEDTPLNLTNIVVTDLDSPNVRATLTLSDLAAGSLSTGTSGSVISTYNDATGVWTASGAIADVNVLLAGVKFNPALNYNSDFTITTSVDDGMAAPITGVKNMTGIAVNDAPIATNPDAPESYTEDTPLDLTDIVISDVDSANVIATLTLSDSAAGGLSTATSGSVTSTYDAATGVWTASGPIADVNALLAGVTFTPAPHYNSNFTIATSVDDGVAAPITGVKNMTGIAVNDAPIATNLNAAETYTEDTPVNLTDIVIADVDSPNVTATLTLSDNAAGSLSTATSGSVTSNFNAATGVWTASGAIADVNVLLAGVTFTPAANYNSNFTIATSIDDGVAAPLTGVKNMVGTAQNDAPTASNLSATETYTLNTPLNLADIVISDVDSANVTATLTLSDPGAGSLNTATSGSVTSTYNAVTGVWTASGAIADVNALLADLTYTPTFLYLFNFTIATSVDDGVAPAITGSKSMTMALINLPPIATNLNAAETYTEDTPLNLTNIVVTDLDSPNVTASLTLSDSAAGSLSTGTSGSVTSTYNAATGVWTASGAKADVNALLAGVTFTPASNYNSNFTIATSVDDGVAAPITGVKNMTGIAVNDAPIATNLDASESYTEDTPLNLTNIVISDVDSGNVTVTLTLSDSAAGGLSTGTSGSVTSTYNAATGVWTASGAIADVNALLAGVTFTPASNYNSDFTIATSVDDGVAAPITGVKNMVGTAQNDAPVLTNNSLTITEGGSVVLSGSELSVTDVDDAAAGLTFTVSGVTGGRFELVSSPGVAITTFTQAQVSGGEVRFVHNGGEAAPSYDVTVSDGTLSDGPATATISFTNQDDAPTATNLNAAQSYTEDTALNLTNIVISDVDSANVTVTLTLSDSGAGSLTTGTSGSVTSTYNAATGIWTASGGIADVNALLAGIIFTPAADYNSNFTITTSVDDGVAPAIIGAKNMTGTPVNDAPVLTSNTLTITEGGSVVLSNGEISATDVDSASLSFTVSGVTGGRFELVSTGAAITTFTQAQVSGGEVRFVHNGGEAAPSYDVTVSDGALSDGPAAATINFTNRNDASEPVEPTPFPEESGQSPAEEPVPRSGGHGPVLNPTPTDRPGPTPGSGGGAENPRLPLTQPNTRISEFQNAVNTTDIQEAEMMSTSSSSSRMFSNPSSETRVGIPAHSEAPSVTPDSELEGTTASTLASADLSSLIDIGGFVQDLDQLRSEIGEDISFDKVVVGSTLALTTGFSIGYAIWLVHGQILLSSILASLPAWRLIDPLPVLAHLNKGSKNDGEDDDSIESVVRKGAEVPESNQVPRQHRGSRSVKWRMVMQTADSI